MGWKFLSRMVRGRRDPDASNGFLAFISVADAKGHGVRVKELPLPLSRILHVRSIM